MQQTLQTTKFKVEMITVISCQNPTTPGRVYALICETCSRLEPKALRYLTSKGKCSYLGFLLLLWSRLFISLPLCSALLWGNPYNMCYRACRPLWPHCGEL